MNVNDVPILEMELKTKLISERIIAAIEEELKKKESGEGESEAVAILENTIEQ